MHLATAAFMRRACASGARGSLSTLSRTFASHTRSRAGGNTNKARWAAKFGAATIAGGCAAWSFANEHAHAASDAKTHVFSWGSSQYGQCGHGKEQPVQILQTSCCATHFTATRQRCSWCPAICK